MADSAETTLNQSAPFVPPAAPPIADYHPPARPHPDLESRSLVDISPPETVRRHSAAWSGLHVETIQVMRHTPFEYSSGRPAICSLLQSSGSATTVKPLLQACPGRPCAISRTS